MKASPDTKPLRKDLSNKGRLRLRFLLLGIGLMVTLAHGAWADVPPALACAAAGHAAEQAAALPANLLVSIGMVESGHPDPLTGRISPWPWTVNADGTGQYFMDKAAAEAFVRLAESSGAHDIDVGCFQVSLQSHPDAFATLDDAFDPAENANYAAGFLNQLKNQTGSWNTAIADYHSAVNQTSACPTSAMSSPPGTASAMSPWASPRNLPTRSTLRRPLRHHHVAHRPPRPRHNCQQPPKRRPGAGVASVITP